MLHPEHLSSVGLGRGLGNCTSGKHGADSDAEKVQYTCREN